MLASRAHWRLLIATAVLLMAMAFAAPKFFPKPIFGENRVLAELPPPPKDLKGFKDYRTGVEAYIKDQFPARAYLIPLLNRLRMLAQVPGTNRVMVGRDGWLFFENGGHLGAARNDPPMTPAEQRGWLQNLASRTATLQQQGIAYVVFAAPMKEMIYPEYTPSWFTGVDPERAGMELPRLAKLSGAGEVIYLGPAVLAAKQRGETVFSRHDTHWNGYGAYAGYAALMTRLNELGLTEGPWPRDRYPKVEAKGGPYDLAVMSGVASFVDFEFPHFTNPEVERTIQTTYLTTSSDWTKPMIIDTGQTGKPVLLMTRDSFSVEMQSLLYSHFSRLILVHDQDGFWRPDLIAKYKPDIVLLEVLEAGLPMAMDSRGDLPAPPETLVRIEKAVMSTAAARRAPHMGRTPRTLAALMDAAAPASHCNLEVATLMSGYGGVATFSTGGWISEAVDPPTSPKGLIRVKGAGADFVAPIAVDRARPDVAAFFKMPAAGPSGFTGEFVLLGAPVGAYEASVYRKTQTGWIVCKGIQPLAVE